MEYFKDIYVVVLSGGKGERMKSLNDNYSKVAYPILGKPIVNYVLDASKAISAKQTFVVVGHGGEITARCAKKDATIVWQKEILGTGHAAMQVLPYLEGKKGDVMILCGDTPLLTGETLKKIYHKHYKSENAVTICSTVLANPKGYGRVLREYPSYKVLGVRPYAEISEEEDKITEINSGIYVVDLEKLQEYLPKLSRDNKKDEYYLSDIVDLMYKDGLKVDAYVLEDATNIYNINDRSQLAFAGKELRRRINRELMLSGVSIEDPETTYISPDVKIERDTIIYPNVTILGECHIGNNNWIGPNTILDNVNMGSNNKIISSNLKNLDLTDNENIGPFVHKEGKQC